MAVGTPKLVQAQAVYLSCTMHTHSQAPLPVRYYYKSLLKF